MTEHKKFSLKSFFTRKKIFYCIYMLLLLVITGSLNIAARKSTAFAEWYSTHI